MFMVELEVKSHHQYLLVRFHIASKECVCQATNTMEVLAKFSIGPMMANCMNAFWSGGRKFLFYVEVQAF